MIQNDQSFEKINESVDNVLTDDWIEGFELGWSWVVDFEKNIYDLYSYEKNSNLLKLLYDAGFTSGKSLGEGILNYFELQSKSLKERAYYFDAFVSKIQFATIKFLKREDHQSLTFVGGTVASQEFRELDEVICHHTGGLIAGCTKALFDRDVVVVESRCRAKGDSDCEFLVWPDD